MQYKKLWIALGLIMFVSFSLWRAAMRTTRC